MFRATIFNLLSSHDLISAHRVQFPQWRHCLVSLSKTLYLLLSTASTQEDRKSSQHDWKIVDWGKSINTNSFLCVMDSFCGTKQHRSWLSGYLLADLDIPSFQKRVKHFWQSYVHSAHIRSNIQYVYCELALIYLHTAYFFLLEGTLYTQ